MGQLTSIVVKSVAVLFLVLAATLIFSRTVQLHTLSAGEPSQSAIGPYRASELDADLRQAFLAYDPDKPWDARETARTLFKTDPLSPLPFVAGMITAAHNDNTAEAKAFAEQVIAIDPRDEASRLLLVEFAIRAGNHDQAMDLLVELMTHDQTRRPLYLDTMSELAKLPETWPLFETVLEEQPDWGAHLADRLSTLISDTALIDRLYAHYPAAHRAYISRLSEAGDMDTAFVSFINYLDNETLDTMTVPFNADFQKVDAPWPFNWWVDDQYGALERNGGLHASYFGREQPYLTYQTLALGPGRYRFQSTTRGEIRENGGHLRWRVECNQTRQELGTLDITDLSTAESVPTFEFSVPPRDCFFQKLILHGVPGEFPGTLRVEIDNVLIQPVRQ